MRHDPPPRSPLWRLYGLVRPVVRPIAWRLRIFMVGPLQDELRAVQAELAALRSELRAREAREAAGLDAKIASVLEQALLTMALEREERRRE